ncbi:MAG: hypothetical protein J5857_12675 [Treponema sp.]|nr:hypothetical protein [Treponema sp.]
MRKNSILVLTAFAFIFVSCGNFLSDVKNEDDKMHNLVYNPVFNSIECRLTADTNAKDGTVITAVCNGVAVQGVAANGKIEYVLDTTFHDGILGGKSYDIHFSADGYLDKTDSIQYWPIIEWEVPVMTEGTRELDRIPVFTGGARDFDLPEIMLKNYDKNSVSVTKTFKLFENYGSAAEQELEENTNGWTVQNLRNFFEVPENAGKTVEVSYSIRPRCSNSEQLERSLCLAYDCKNDVLVQSAQIKYEYGQYRPYLYDASNNLAGGNIAYQWQSSDDNGNTWTDIEGATEKTYRITETDIGKELRVQIVQTMGEEEKPAKVSDIDLVHNHICDYALYYDGTIKVGETFDTSKIRGTLTDSLGRTYNAEDCTWETVDPESFYTANDGDGSKFFSFLVTFDAESEPDNAEVFATVRYADLDETYMLSKLSRNIDTISFGRVKFIESDDNMEYEYSTDNGATFREFALDEVKVGANRALYIRKRACGIPGFGGYIKESEAICLTIPEEYIGIKTLTAGDGIITGFAEPKITLEKSESGSTITVTPRLTNVDDWYQYEYIWRVDGLLLSDCEWYNDGISIDDNVMIIDKTKLPNGDTYMIFCLVKISSEGLEDELMVLSDQVSVKIQ